VFLLLPALLALGACGDGGSSGANAADDKKVADAAVLKLTDFPSGWTEGPPPDETDDANDPFTKCLGSEAKELEANTSAEAESADFERGEGTTASSFVAVLKSEDNGTSAMDVLGSQKLKDCFNQALADELETTAGAEEGVTIGEATLKEASFGTVGDETVAMQLSVPVSAEAIEIVFYADLVFFREGRSIGGLFLGNLETPFPSSEGQELAKKMAARMKAA
jgi:hypothetical protein